MSLIQLQTMIHAGIRTCFDLSRSIDLHKISTAHTNEAAIAGCMEGLIGPGEFVTWEATHFGIRQRLSTQITAFDPPFHFRDEQIKGPFKSMVHDHYFTEKDGIVTMSDIFAFRAPLGPLGRLADLLVLKRYMAALLEKRNQTIKTFAESGQWTSVLQ
ncbi:MAG: SRPBCC family protein [Chitinophagaceae bacterium]|nr:SRPBCC family protein [Chitinophagaceae bacterium]